MGATLSRSLRVARGTHAIEALNINKLSNLQEDIWVADAASNVTFAAYDKIDITNEYVYDYKPLLRSDIRKAIR